MSLIKFKPKSLQYIFDLMPFTKELLKEYHRGWANGYEEAVRDFEKNGRFKEVFKPKTKV